MVNGFVDYTQQKGKNKMKTYIIHSKNSHILQNSSSGSMFAELAKFVLSKNGVVFGCAMERGEDGFDVKHIYIEDENELIIKSFLDEYKKFKNQNLLNYTGYRRIKFKIIYKYLKIIKYFILNLRKRA